MRNMHKASVVGQIMEQNVLSRSACELEALAPTIKTPTLILHSREDVLVPADQSRWLASQIPNARLMLIDARNHAPGFISSYDALVLAELEAFTGVA